MLADPEDLGGSDRSVVARARVARNPFSLPRTLVVKHYRDEPCARSARPVPVRGGERPAVHLDVARAAAQPGAHRPRPGVPAARHGGPRAQLHAGRQALRARRRRRAALPAVLGGRARPDAGGHCGPGEGLRRAPAPSRRARLARPDGRRGARGVRGSRGAVARRAGRRRAPPPRCRRPTTPPGCSAAPATGRSARRTPARTTTWSPAAACASSTSSGAASATSRSTPPTSGCPSRAARRASRCRRGWPTRCSPPGATRSPPCGPTSRSPGRLDARLFDAQLLWVWLCTWWFLPRIRVRDQHVGQDAGRSPRISTALSHYWDQLAADAAVAGKAATAELGVAVAEALNKRFPDAPAALPVYPAFRTRRPDGARQAARRGAGRRAAGACAVAMVRPASISQSCARVQVGQIQVTRPSASCWLLHASPAGVVRGAGERAQRAGSGGLHGSEGAGGGLRNGYGTANNAVR